MSVGLRQFHATLLVHHGAERDGGRVVVGKNYRVQNIQLSKIRLPAQPAILLSVHPERDLRRCCNELTEKSFVKERRLMTLPISTWLANRSSFSFDRQPAFALRAAARNLRVHS
jgi:hypothetical protein